MPHCTTDEKKRRNSKTNRLGRSVKVFLVILLPFVYWSAKRLPGAPLYRNEYSLDHQSTVKIPHQNCYKRADALYQSSSSSFFCMAFFLASNASARLLPRLGVGVLLRLLSDPLAPLLMTESRGVEACACRFAGLRPAAGLLAGGAGGVGLARAAPFWPPGGGGGARGAGAGAGSGACSST